tara:strand:+ start:463 stop:579 length:117 start_codon:yes stop_codon:yes gene_type:complete
MKTSEKKSYTVKTVKPFTLVMDSSGALYDPRNRKPKSK